MRFLADENIPKTSLLALREAGHDVLAVAEASPGISDSDVLRLSISEERILITFDRDFGSMVFRASASAAPGIVLFRLIPVTPEEPAIALLTLIEHTDIDFIGRFTVIDRDRVRQRLLPEEGDAT